MSFKVLSIVMLIPILALSGCTFPELGYQGYRETNQTVSSAEDALMAFQDYFNEYEPEVQIDKINLKIENIRYMEIQHKTLGKVSAWIFNDGYGDKLAVDENGGIMYKIYAN